MLLLNAMIMSKGKLKALKLLKRYNDQIGRFMSLDNSAILVARSIKRQIERGDIVIYSLWKELQEGVSS